MGDFAAPGFLAPLDEYAQKWNAVDDFYDTFLLNYGYVNGVMYGILFDCDIQMVHVRNKYMEQLLGGPVDRVNSIPTYDGSSVLQKNWIRLSLVYQASV